MGSLARPSQYVLRQAASLGQKMARKEQRLAVDLSFCNQYSSYEVFRTVNRARLLNQAALAIWDEQLQSLVRRCVNRLGYSIDTIGNWGAIEQLVVQPIQDAFWTGWEQAIDLQGLYQEAVRAHKTIHSHITLPVSQHVADVLPAAVSHPTVGTPDRPPVEGAHPGVTGSTSGAFTTQPVAARPPADVRGGKSRWYQVLQTIYDVMGIADDDRFGAATGARVESDHTEDESLDNLPNVFGPIRRTVGAMPVTEQGESPQPETPADMLHTST